jgi:hypothetical protein
MDKVQKHNSFNTSGVRPEDTGGHTVGRPLPIHLPAKCFFLQKLYHTVMKMGHKNVLPHSVVYSF